MIRHTRRVGHVSLGCDTVVTAKGPPEVPPRSGDPALIDAVGEAGDRALGSLSTSSL